MTDAEFRTWTRHTAENAMSQRDDALARINAADAKAAGDKALADKALADTKTAHAGEMAAKDVQLAGLQSQIDAMGGTEMGQQLAKQRAREAAVAKAKAAAEAKTAADAELAAFDIGVRR